MKPEQDMHAELSSLSGSWVQGHFSDKGHSPDEDRQRQGSPTEIGNSPFCAQLREPSGHGGLLLYLQGSPTVFYAMEGTYCSLTGSS